MLDLPSGRRNVCPGSASRLLGCAICSDREGVSTQRTTEKKRGVSALPIVLSARLAIRPPRVSHSLRADRLPGKSIVKSKPTVVRPCPHALVERCDELSGGNMAIPSMFLAPGRLGERVRSLTAHDFFTTHRRANAALLTRQLIT